MATPINGIYVLQGVVPSDIAAAPVTAKVVEMYDDSGNLLSAAQVAQMEAGGGQVLGYFSIGEAENYRSYWSSVPSSILGPQDPAWPGDYQVAYWTPQWLTVAEGEIQKMITQGYNGAYFDVVGEATETWAQQNAPGGDAEGAMVKLIQELGAFAHAQNPNFKIWINSSGAEPMLSNPALINAIDGVFEEQLYYQSATKATSSADLSYNVSLLDNVTKAGKPVVAIEYISGAAQVASVESQAAANGFGYYIANPNLDLVGVDTQGFAGLTPPTPPAAAAPTVTITSKGGTVTQAAQTITGTVDVADAGTTVNVLDGTTKIGSAVVAADGTWSAKVTLANQGANVLTATDTNAAGTGTSNSITDTLSTPTSTALTLAIDSPTLNVTGGGGQVQLGIHETAPDSATSASITIKGLPWYETITDRSHHTYSGGHTIKISADQVEGLILTSNYQGTRDPVATLQITANATVAGVTSHSPTKTLIVTDPPATSTSTATTGKLALLNQYIASGFDNHSGGAPLMSNVASAFGHDDSFLTSPRHA